MINPTILNVISCKIRGFPLSFNKSNGLKNFHYAFDKSVDAYDLPVAIYPVQIHMRMHVQRSCFYSAW
jgi:hypothetical protein